MTAGHVYYLYVGLSLCTYVIIDSQITPNLIRLNIIFCYEESSDHWQ